MHVRNSFLRDTLCAIRFLRRKIRHGFYTLFQKMQERYRDYLK